MCKYIISFYLESNTAHKANKNGGVCVMDGQMILVTIMAVVASAFTLFALKAVSDILWKDGCSVEKCAVGSCKGRSWHRPEYLTF